MALIRKQRHLEAKGASFGTTLFLHIKAALEAQSKLCCLRKMERLLYDEHFGGYKAKSK